MIGKHIRVILDSESDNEPFTAFARTLAVGEDILQGEGGLTFVSDRLFVSERIFAFLDDIYSGGSCVRDRPPGASEARKHRHHSGKTKIWNRSGVTPTGVIG